MKEARLNVIIMCGMGIIFIVGPLLAIYHYKTLPDLPKKVKEQTLPKDAKVFRPPKWRFILIDVSFICIGIIISIILISVIRSFHPPRYPSSYYPMMVGIVGTRILMRLFLPLFKVDDLMLIISREEVTSTMFAKRITFPISEIDQEIGTTTPNEINETNKWVVYRYMKAIQRKMKQWFGREYIYSVDGEKIELSFFHFRREQINEILNEVKNVTKAFANNEEQVTKTDTVE